MCAGVDPRGLWGGGGGGGPDSTAPFWDPQTSQRGGNFARQFAETHSVLSELPDRPSLFDVLDPPQCVLERLFDILMLI